MRPRGDGAPRLGQSTHRRPAHEEGIGTVRTLLVLMLVAVPAFAGLLTYIGMVEDGVGGVEGLAGAMRLAISPDGDNLYVTGHNDDSLAVFDRSQADGSLSFVEVHTALASPIGVAISPEGNHVYVASNAGHSLEVFRRNPSTGRLDHVRTYEDGVEGIFGLEGANAVTVSPDGSLVFVTGEGQETLAVFSRDACVDDLVLADVEQNGVGGVTLMGAPSSVAVDPTSRYVHVTAQADDNIAVFMRDPCQDAVAFSRDEAVIAGPASSAFRGHGSVYVVGGNKLQFLARAGASGNLFPAQTFEDGVDSVDGLLDASSVAVAPAGFAVFATGRGDAAVAAFHRSKIPGDLDFWEAMFDGAGGVSGLTGAESVAVSPDSRFLYVAGFLDDAVAVFSIKPIIFSDRFSYGTGWELDETWSGAYGDGLDVVSTEYYSPYYALQVTATSTCAAGTYDVYLSSQTIYDSRSYESCASITAGDNFVIANGGSATFAAANVIVLQNGFAVDPGGLFTADIDPSLSHLSYVRDDSPDSEPTYNVEFFVDADNLTMGADDEIQHFASYDQDGIRLVRLSIVAGPAVILEVRDATEMSYQTPGIALAPGWNKIAITWEASSSATASLSVNDGATEELMGLDTESHRIDSVRWGVLGGTLDSTSGTIVLDDFTSWR